MLGEFPEGEATFTDQDYRHIAGWLAHGYQRARRRYRRVIGGACGVGSLFVEIMKECDRALKHAEEGAQLTVYASMKRAHARVECDYPTEY